MPKSLTITVSHAHIDRIKDMFRKTLGRDLTPEEARYLGLSSTVITIGEPEAGEHAHKDKVRTFRAKVKMFTTIRERKLA